MQQRAERSKGFWRRRSTLSVAAWEAFAAEGRIPFADDAVAEKDPDLFFARGAYQDTKEEGAYPFARSAVLLFAATGEVFYSMDAEGELYGVHEAERMRLALALLYATKLAWRAEELEKIWRVHGHAMPELIGLVLMALVDFGRADREVVLEQVRGTVLETFLSGSLADTPVSEQVRLMFNAGALPEDTHDCDCLSMITDLLKEHQVAEARRIARHIRRPSNAVDAFTAIYACRQSMH
ncbi:MAG: hypothetical protein Q7R83_01015 [bacterium]|nr:hypothetical protein [bacterium]